MRCDDVNELFDAYLADELDGHRRDAMRAHLRSCSACRAAATRHDASLLFAAADPVEPDVARLDEITRSVLGEIRRERLASRIERRRSPWLAVAAVAVLSVAGAISWRQLTSPGPGDTAQSAVRPAVQQVERSSPPPRVEVNMPGEGVRVYQYADGQNGDTAATFIVNPELEL
jgi:anti-sigma factor RsiW